jgi:DNA-binding NtrC family response regulator
MATMFGVAPMTIRHVLARLEQEGFVSRQQGRGTFVNVRTTPAVLIVEDDLSMRSLLRAHILQAGHRVIEASGPSEARAGLEHDPAIALILSDVHVPTRAAGLDFIRLVRHRWPQVPLAVVTGYPDDLAELHGTPECPVLILAKPVWARQVEEVLRLVLPPRERAWDEEQPLPAAGSPASSD